MNAIRKILVPTDFSAHADEAFRAAQTLAAALGAEVVVFHVAQPPTVVSDGGPLLAGPNPAQAGNLWDRLQGAYPANPMVRVVHEVIVADRPSAPHILEILDKLGCDLIVMGTHGHSRIKHLLFGSMTDAVVRGARCPVMVVKAPAPVEDPPAPVPAAVDEPATGQAPPR